MLIDTEQIETGTTISSQVAIVGGGMAGLALARQLADSGLSVAIFESGGESPDAKVQDLYAGTMTVGTGDGNAEPNDAYLTNSRVRCLGGSGNVWGAKCGPLDPLDFEKRTWVPYSGWPVTRRSLQPYYDRACDLLQLPHFASPPDHGREGVFDGATRAFTPRTRAYTRYTGALKGGPFEDYKRAATGHARIAVHLKANVTRIAMDPGGRRVLMLDVKTLTGRSHQVRADTYILATGGIENIRLLLASADVVTGGIGNHSGWLGRGFLGHTTISRDNTTVWLRRSGAALAAYNIMRNDGPHAVLGLSDAAQSSSRSLNFTVTLTGELKNAASSSVAVQQIASLAAANPERTELNIYFMVEHAPNRDSRIVLDPSRRDALGMPRVRLDMRHAEIERETLDHAVRTLARELGRTGAGRVQWGGTNDDWRKSLTSLSRHHMGATRMATSPSEGVVDEYGRVHGVENLYIAGSSTFPTSGITNPTLTLLALGFRMGDRLIAAKGNVA